MLTIRLEQDERRKCSGCSLCCKLLPVRELGKGAGERCQHQKFKKGCTVYGRPSMPPSCRLWNCRWLVNNDTADLPRPDRAHYVIDIMPDFVTVRDNATGAMRPVEVVQIWCDPAFRDAWREPHLLAFLERRGREGIAALVRFGSKSDAIGVFPPSMSDDGKWHEVHNGVAGPEHTVLDFLRAWEGHGEAENHGKEKTAAAQNSADAA